MAGTDDPSNLALACGQCNLHKGPNLSGIDPESGELTRLFHPRTDVREHHFLVESGLVMGLSAIGRTSVYVMGMNSENRIAMRRVLARLGIKPFA